MLDVYESEMKSLIEWYVRAKDLAIEVMISAIKHIFNLCMS